MFLQFCSFWEEVLEGISWRLWYEWLTLSNDHSPSDSADEPFCVAAVMVTRTLDNTILLAQQDLGMIDYQFSVTPVNQWENDEKKMGKLNISNTDVFLP